MISRSDSRYMDRVQISRNVPQPHETKQVTYAGLMPKTRLRLTTATRPSSGWNDLRNQLGIVDEFSHQAEQEALTAAQKSDFDYEDQTDIDLFTVDPTGSKDLDQAMHLERTSGGFRIRYAIADVASFVCPVGMLGAETHQRGVTYYSPDRNVPLHPVVLSEAAASLLPNQTRPAALWDLQIDNDGALRNARVARAMVSSKRQLDYATVEHELEGNTENEQLQLLREIGCVLETSGEKRGAIDLPSPEQVVTDGPDGKPSITFRAPLRSESWNAQVSLLTGMAAAKIMLDAGVGLLRTLPPPTNDAVQRLRRSALGLGFDWPDSKPYNEVISKLDPHDAKSAALLNLAPRLLRGAGYVAFDGTRPKDFSHRGLAAPYAHATAPLRRMADRYVSEICLSVCADQPIPAWVREALGNLPSEMGAAERRSHSLERATVQLAESLVMAPHIGEIFVATIVDVDEKHRAIVQIASPAVRGHCEGDNLQLGTQVKVKLVVADPALRAVKFEVVNAV